jgi:predicted outer membrane protein
MRTVDEVGDKKMAEATLASLVASNEAVRIYALELVEEYRMLRVRQSELGISLGFIPLKGERAAAFERQIERDVLALITRRGESFDRLFLARMIDDHESALKTLEKELLPRAKADEIRTSLETDVKPLLEGNLVKARELLKTIDTPGVAGAESIPPVQ